MFKNIFIKYEYEQYRVRFFSLGNGNIELFASNEYNTKEYTIIIHVDDSDMDDLVEYLMNIENIISIFEYADEFSLRHYNYSSVYGLKEV